MLATVMFTDMVGSTVRAAALGDRAWRHLTGARVAALASPGEVLVSQTVNDLVAGSGLRCADRGAHTLEGVPGEWRLHAVERGS